MLHYLSLLDSPKSRLGCRCWYRCSPMVRKGALRGSWSICFGNGSNTVSGSTVSNTELSELFGAHWVSGSELSEFLSAYYLCVNTNSPSFSQNSPSLPQKSVRLSEFSSPKQYSRNSIPPVSRCWLCARGSKTDSISRECLQEIRHTVPFRCNKEPSIAWWCLSRTLIFAPKHEAKVTHIPQGAARLHALRHDFGIFFHVDSLRIFRGYFVPYKSFFLF